MNAAAFSAVSKLEAVNYVGPINPSVVPWQKLLSKSVRMLGSQGAYFFFSKRRLARISREVRARCIAGARLDFYHGFTPWILSQSPRPFVAWSDCTFHDYIDIYNRREEFDPADLERIEQTEAAWLSNARHVLFTSDWAARRAIEHYGLDSRRVGVVGIFGEIEAPSQDAYAGDKQFVYVSTNFRAKGGHVVLAAFRAVRKLHPEATLVVVGDKPSNIMMDEGVIFEGFLRKEVPREHARLMEILGRARAVVHPTKSDISPLLVVEAGYFGCPVISSRRFAIPELIDDKRTGILLDDSSEIEAVLSAMRWMLEDDRAYVDMRRAAWTKAHGQHSKALFEQRFLSCLREAMAA